MTDIKDRLHQMMLRSGFQSRDDQQTLLAGAQEIERLRAELSELRANLRTAAHNLKILAGNEQTPDKQ